MIISCTHGTTFFFPIRYFMLFLYNILQILFLLICWPIILAIVLYKDKYRKRIPQRLGFNLSSTNSNRDAGKKTIWVHALSLGEVTSAFPLILALRSQLQNVHIVFSSTTSTGSQIAQTRLSKYVDQIIPFPIDLLPVASHYIKKIQPDMFVLVETDFWPNLLHALHRKGIPTLLVNGRISQSSMESYQRFSFFFTPLFQSFTYLCMQAERDKKNMIDLGVDGEKILSLGNLKFDTPLPPTSDSHGDTIHFPDDHIILIAGSTHEGEEEIILKTFSKLKNDFQIFLVIAPRDIARVNEIEQLATSMHLTCDLRSRPTKRFQDVLLLNTLGELFSFYRNGDIAFVGGSLIPFGGHNPIEPAILGVPVIFGSHMTEFTDISKGLVDAGGAFSVKDENGLYDTFRKLIEEEAMRVNTGKSAFEYVNKHQGVINRHITLIKKLM